MLIAFSPAQSANIEIKHKMEKTMKLYDYPASPNARRVRVFAHEKAISLELVSVDLIKMEYRKPSYLSKNPFALVPLLELDDGTLISESRAICRYLEEISPDPPLFGQTPKQKAIIDMWQSELEYNFIQAVGNYFRNKSSRFVNRALGGFLIDIPQIPELVKRSEVIFPILLERYDKQLSHHDFLGGHEFSIADITFYVYLQFARKVNLSIPEGFDNILEWEEKVGLRPSIRG